MLLDHIGHKEAAGRVRAGVGRVLEDGTILTPDLGGSGTITGLTDAICAAVSV
jgi:isocitrate/isopropylmalate dehydrogenase